MRSGSAVPADPPLVRNGWKADVAATGVVSATASMPAMRGRPSAIAALTDGRQRSRMRLLAL